MFSCLIKTLDQKLNKSENAYICLLNCSEYVSKKTTPEKFRFLTKLGFNWQWQLKDTVKSKIPV